MTKQNAVEEKQPIILKDKQFRIGNQTAISSKTVWEPFEYAVSKGFDAFEWFPDKFHTYHISSKIQGKAIGWKENDLVIEDRKRIKNTATEKDIALSVHVPLSATVFTEEGKERLNISIAFAKDIGAKILNTHLERSIGIDLFIETAIPVWQKALDAGLSVAVENTPGDPPEAMNELFSLLEGKKFSGKERIGMCLDLGHANLHPTSNDYWKFLDTLKSNVPIIHIHIHENNGQNDEHLPVFTGPSRKDNSKGIKGALSRLIQRKYHGMMIMEQWPKPVSLLEDSRNKLLACLQEMV